MKRQWLIIYVLPKSGDPLYFTEAFDDVYLTSDKTYAAVFASSGSAERRLSKLRRAYERVASEQKVAPMPRLEIVENEIY